MNCESSSVTWINARVQVLFEPLPVVHMYAINSTSGRNSQTYECPIYKKPKRTDLTYIASADLRTSLSPDHWVMRGVALLCDSSDHRFR